MRRAATRRQKSDADQRDETALRADRGSGGVWAIIVIVLQMPVMMMCGTHREGAFTSASGQTMTANRDRRPAYIQWPR